MSTTTDIEYNEYTAQLLNVLQQQHNDGIDISVASCTEGLEPGRDHKKVRDFAIKILKIRASEFDNAISRNNVANKLGQYPKSPREFIELMAQRMQITARYNGLLHKNEPPYVIDGNGQQQFIDPALWNNYEFKMLVRKFHCDYQYNRFILDVRCASREYKLPFHMSDLNDAGEKWYHETCEARIQAISRQIDYTDSVDVREIGRGCLKLLAQDCFDCEKGDEFVVAIFEKFIWQVKRKIAGLPIFDHLMPVILGGQGVGKSTLIRKLLEPVEELRAMTDFKQITDDRNISLWRNFVIFLDEMGWASKSDMDTVKNVLTAPTLTRRVMQTNFTQEVVQNATFIGASNAEQLNDLIRDESGTRRFVSLQMKDNPNRELINTIDWTSVWQCVDEQAEDPITVFKGVLQTVQAADRTKSPVEVWLDDLDPKGYPPGVKMSSNFLFKDYTQYEISNFPGLRNRLSSVVFSRQLAKLLDKKHDWVLLKTISHNQAMYQVRQGNPNLRLVTE